MKKTNFFKLLLVGAMALTLGFTGCQNVSQSDFDDLCKQVNAIDARVAELERIIGGPGKTVQDVSGPSADNELTVTYTDGTSKKIALNAPEGKAPYVVENEDGSYTLFIVPKDAKEYVSIEIPTAANGLVKIDILGYLNKYYDYSTNISMGTLDGNDASDILVNWAYVADYKLDGTGDAWTSGTDGDTTGATTTDAPNPWPGGATPLAKKIVLNTLGADGTGLVVQVHPASADITGLTFDLVSAKGGKLPISLSKAVPIVGNLTRAASASGLYYISGGYTSTTYNNAAAYAKFYTDNAGVLYALRNGNTVVSEYTKFSFAQQQVTSKEGPVIGVEGVADGKPVGFTGIPTPGYNVIQGSQYAPYFETSTALNATVQDGVLDWYLEIADPTQFIAGKFGITFSADKTAFTVTRLPDDLTLATFKLHVYKLAVDGMVYREDITIRPVRAGLTYTLPIGNYTLTDDNTYNVPAGGAAPDFSTTFPLSAKKVIDLKPMFDDLATKDAGSGTTMKQRWQNGDGYGAGGYQFKSVSIDGTVLSSNLYTQFTTAFFQAGGTISFNDKADGTGNETGHVPGSHPALNTSLSIVFQPPYAVQDGALGATDSDTDPDPAFQIGKEYAITFDFVDGDGDYINSLVLTFTPIIPPLADMYKRESAYWEGNTLYAYYRNPNDPQQAGFFYTAGYGGGAATSTYYNVLRTKSDDVHTAASPHDGGFTSFGIANNDSKMWLASSDLTYVDANSKPGSTGATTINVLAPIRKDAVYGTSVKVGSVVELTLQDNPVSGSDNGYGQVLKMRIQPGKYLNVYAYDSNEVNAQDFDMKILSALYEGEIKPGPKSAEPIPAGAIGTVLKLNSDYIVGANYANQPYSVFKTIIDDNHDNVAQASEIRYKYTYISSVAFAAPAATTTYTITNIVAPTIAVVNSATVITEEYVEITTSNLVPGNNPTSIDVTVTDRFGKVKKGNVQFTIHL